MLVVCLPENASTLCSAVSGASKPPLPQGWSGPDWPASLGRSAGGASHMGMGTSLGMGTSPFGRSVDMVDVVTQLMEAGGAWCHRLLPTAQILWQDTRPAVPPLGFVPDPQT